MKKINFSSNCKKHDGLHPISESILFIYNMYFVKNDIEVIKIFCNKANNKLLLSIIENLQI